MEKKEYVTNNADLDGLDYRTMSRIMTNAGYKMNHATARNVLFRAMKKFAHGYCKALGVDSHKQSITRIINDPRFQSGLGALVQDQYTVLEKNNTEK
jgi:hypothetical protein